MRFALAATAAALLATSAHAQVAQSQGSAPPVGANAGDLSTTGRDSTNGATTNSQPLASADPAGQNMPAQAGGASMPGAPGMTANMPSGDAPSTYPVCSKRGQDRCRAPGRRGS